MTKQLDKLCEDIHIHIERSAPEDSPRITLKYEGFVSDPDDQSTFGGPHSVAKQKIVEWNGTQQGNALYAAVRAAVEASEGINQ